jgi:hypothetical protein
MEPSNLEYTFRLGAASTPASTAICALLFADVTHLGTGATCVKTLKSTFLVVLGEDYTLRVDDILSLNLDKVVPENCDVDVNSALTTPSQISVLVNPDVNEFDTTLLMNLINNVSICQEIVLTLQSSISTKKVEWANQWPIDNNSQLNTEITNLLTANTNANTMTFSPALTE